MPMKGTSLELEYETQRKLYIVFRLFVQLSHCALENTLPTVSVDKMQTHKYSRQRLKIKQQVCKHKGMFGAHWVGKTNNNHHNWRAGFFTALLLNPTDLTTTASMVFYVQWLPRMFLCRTTYNEEHQFTFIHSPVLVAALDMLDTQETNSSWRICIFTEQSGSIHNKTDHQSEPHQMVNNFGLLLVRVVDHYWPNASLALFF